jgi:hypothetical protein
MVNALTKNYLNVVSLSECPVRLAGLRGFEPNKLLVLKISEAGAAGLRFSPV